MFDKRRLYVYINHREICLSSAHSNGRCGAATVFSGRGHTGACYPHVDTFGTGIVRKFLNWGSVDSHFLVNNLLVDVRVQEVAYFVGHTFLPQSVKLRGRS